ncbi:pyridoxamine kinase [Oscillibacter sp. MSJ-2]|uniref:Pyridoxamine kinase n=2 Tax=Dysosmobacter acutus TaxID=2841504 RepID=A0ABS6F7B5_9FIRM|nr:pyridoxamine kinase [Dysosmobacter acutus]
MPTPRVAAIHDMSGFGRCSLTVAIPVLSAMGVQCCPLPTAFLSTHTGGFTGYTFLDMTDEMPKVAAHWRELGLRFDAIYSGFMGSERQMEITAEFIRTFRRDESTVVVVDPVMGDHGQSYATYTPAMCDAMARMATLADVITPNLTEAAFLLGVPYEALRTDAHGYCRCVEKLSLNGRRSVVLTGVSLEPAKIGAACFDARGGKTEIIQTTFETREFHGTGDVFASVLTGALVRGRGLMEAVSDAVEFVRDCAAYSAPQNLPVREGVDFEPLLWKLHRG